MEFLTEASISLLDFFFGEAVLKQTEYIMSTVQKSHDLM